MTVRINASKIAFVGSALAVIIGALTLSSPSTEANVQQSAVVSGGKTTLKPTKRMIRKLKRAKAAVKPIGSAKGGLRKLVFPVTGGRVVLQGGELDGKIRHRGSGFRVMKGPVILPFRNPVVSISGVGLSLDPGASSAGSFVGGCAVKNCPATMSGDEELGALIDWMVLDTDNFKDGGIRLEGEVRFTKRGARVFRSALDIKVRKGTTLGITDIQTGEIVWD